MSDWQILAVIGMLIIGESINYLHHKHCDLSRWEIEDEEVRGQRRYCTFLDLWWI